MFKRSILALCAMIMGGLLLVQGGAIAASDYGLNETAGAAKYNIGEKGINKPVITVVNAVLGVLVFIFFFLVISAGLKWMSAAGNEDAIGEAKDTIQRAVIGLVVVTAAYGITTFVFNILDKTPKGGGATNAQTAPVTTGQGTECTKDADCTAKKMCVNGYCVASVQTNVDMNDSGTHCYNTKQDSDETGVDCGGSCATLYGKTCSS